MKYVYFIGIGGIGMSAIARYFHSKGYGVAGYDLTSSPLTRTLQNEGIDIHYSDEVNLIPEPYRDLETLVVYTPAVPSTHRELGYYRAQGNRVLKRSEILGEITRLERGLCVAGTHGKTTTSSLLAHLLYSSHVGCNAFLGGISNNYKTNLLLSDCSDLVVIEADEFDRSFHRLSPYMAIITSADPDHLDIYGTPEAYRESFEYFTSLIDPSGCLVMRQGIPLTPRLHEGVRFYQYAVNEPTDFYASEVRVEHGRLFFRWHYPEIGATPAGSLVVELGVPLLINVENAVAAMAVAYLSGAKLDELVEGLRSFRGVHRRFDRVVDSEPYVLIDDYAHHPVELEASIASVRGLYPDRRIMGIFQPHLYSRTRDFYREFAESLDKLDEIILLDIYPARDLPIPGVTSSMIAEQMQNPHVSVMDKSALLPHLSELEKLPDVILMVGAGDVDRLVPDVANLLRSRL
ncbi:MAG: UDP-N-acetylmuramate--L-alanine ligase [Porphyromonadaceae bacterium]|nr:UDP-N-acetylmuramate--L-alanine ligase [Porphyromonadaceae bacterium]